MISTAWAGSLPLGRPAPRSARWLGPIATRSRKPSCEKGTRSRPEASSAGTSCRPSRSLRLDPEALEVDVKFGPKAGAPPDRLDLIPGGPYDNEVLREAVRRVAQSVLAGGGRYPAIEALLARQHPTLTGHTRRFAAHCRRRRYRGGDGRCRAPARPRHAADPGAAGDGQDLCQLARHSGVDPQRQAGGGDLELAQGDRQSADGSGGAGARSRRRAEGHQENLQWRGPGRSGDRGDDRQRGCAPRRPTRWSAAPPGCLRAPSTISSSTICSSTRRAKCRLPTSSRPARRRAISCWSVIRCSWRSRFRACIPANRAARHWPICSMACRRCRPIAASSCRSPGVCIR